MRIVAYDPASGTGGLGFAGGAFSLRFINVLKNAEVNVRHLVAVSHPPLPSARPGPPNHHTPPRGDRHFQAGRREAFGLGSAHPVQRAQLVAVGVAQISQIHLAHTAFAHAGRLFTGRAAIGDAGRVPRIGHLR